MENKNIYIILGMLIIFMGSFIVVNVVNDFSGFLTYMGFAGENQGTFVSWALATLTILFYCWSAASISDVKHYMFMFDRLKLLTIVAAICAGVVEEIIFRKWVMDYLNNRDFSIVAQILASGIAFGVAHAIWGIRNVKAGINAVLSTFLLGIVLGIIYWVGERSLAPCIFAHFVISALIEPGLLISANNNRLGYWSEKKV